MIGGTVTTIVAPGLEAWSWTTSLLAVFGAMWLRARRMQANETDADLRAIELCGNPDALIRALTRIYEINHIPRRWSAMAEEHASHPSLARRLRAIRDRMAATDAAPEPLERLVVASSEPDRCAVIDHHRIAFLWMNGGLGDTASVLERANRVEMMTYDQLSELRLSARRGAIALLAVGRHSRRWSMPIHESDAGRVQAALDRIDHLVVAPASRRDLGIARRTAALLVILLAAPYNAIGAVLVPALLALRRPQRPIMMSLAAALAGTAIASVNERGVSTVRFALLTILAIAVVWSSRRRPVQEPQPDTPVWTWIEHVALLIPVVIGLVIAAASGPDLFGLHSAVRDRAWVTAAIAAVATFWFVESGRRLPRRAGLGAAIAATASLVVGSPWFLLHAVADPLVAPMPYFLEKAVPTTTLARQTVNGYFTAVHVTPDGNHFLLGGEYEENVESEEEVSEVPPRFVAGGFDGWSRELHAFDADVIDDRRLLVLDRDRISSRLRAEDLRSGQSQWTITLPDLRVELVQAASDGRWRAFARRGRQFERIEGRVGSAAVTSTRWTVASDKQSYLDLPRNDGSTVALAVASLWQEPTLTWLLSDWHHRTRLLRIDATGTREIAASNLRVHCASPQIDVTGIVCVSVDGRSSRFWRVDLSSGRLVPVGETSHILWQLTQPSQHLIASVSDGRPLLADLESETVMTLLPDKWCSASGVAISHHALVAACNDGRNTVATKYPLPADVH
jgi:hypothetical protein